MAAKKRPGGGTWVKHHKRRNHLALGLVTAILVIMIVGLSSLSPTGAKVGQQAPTFSLPDINNVSFKLSENRGKPVLLEFMTTTCHFCTQQAPILSELWLSHKMHVAFVSISVDSRTDQPGILAAYSQTHNMPWIWIRDTSGVGQLYGVTGTPTICLLDSNGVVNSMFAGVTDLQTLDARCKSLP